MAYTTHNNTEHIPRFIYYACYEGEDPSSGIFPHNKTHVGLQQAIKTMYIEPVHGTSSTFLNAIVFSEEMVVSFCAHGKDM